MTVEVADIYESIDLLSPYELPQKLLVIFIKLAGFATEHKVNARMLAELAVGIPKGAIANKEGRVSLEVLGKIYSPAMDKFDEVSAIHSELASRPDDTKQEHDERKRLLEGMQRMLDTFHLFDVTYGQNPNAATIIGLTIHGMIDVLISDPLYSLFRAGKGKIPKSVDERMDEELNYRNLIKYLDPESEDAISWKYLFPYVKMRLEYHAQAQEEIKRLIGKLPTPNISIPVELAVRKVLEGCTEDGALKVSQEYFDQKLREACAPLL